MPRVEKIINKLNRARETLLRVADSVPADQWKLSPGSGSWSAGELVAHLVMVDRRVLRDATKITQKPLRPTPVFRRLHLPLAVVEARWIRRKSPTPIDRNPCLKKRRS